MTVRVTDSTATSWSTWWAKRRTPKARAASRPSPGTAPVAPPPATS
ncbi:hypothetical protein VA596_40700 [Amycolatopsis sp., V23-08]|uniref:Uncharacterized protein n=1 Tax=Amycolatopsis heterodermiae TaxID=3110235 RepID=A0ABU5RHZ3_9PSEU|nr:hypothetical protein [Amycolatopsis sp., V23-08]MEA5365903.1 hypothetical protein [Amycolatopsis sp., V23-08]